MIGQHILQQLCLFPFPLYCRVETVPGPSSHGNCIHSRFIVLVPRYLDQPCGPLLVPLAESPLAPLALEPGHLAELQHEHSLAREPCPSHG